MVYHERSWRSCDPEQRATRIQSRKFRSHNKDTARPIPTSLIEIPSLMVGNASTTRVSESAQPACICRRQTLHRASAMLWLFLAMLSTVPADGRHADSAGLRMASGQVPCEQVRRAPSALRSAESSDCMAADSMAGLPDILTTWILSSTPPCATCEVSRLARGSALGAGYRKPPKLSRTVEYL